MPAYETGAFDPPAPVAHVIVAGSNGALARAELLLDTGADVSSVPRTIVEQLGILSRQSGFLLQMYDGNQSLAQVADLTITLGKFRFTGSFVVADADHGVLGRNILNLLRVTFDGPQLEWSF